MGSATDGPGWQGFPAGYSPVLVVCSRHGSRVLVRRGAAAVLPDGFTDVQWQPREGEPVATGVVHGDGGRTFKLRCPRCGHSPDLRQETLVRVLEALVKAGRLDSKGRLVLDIAGL